MSGYGTIRPPSSASPADIWSYRFRSTTTYSYIDRRAPLSTTGVNLYQTTTISTPHTNGVTNHFRVQCAGGNGVYLAHRPADDPVYPGETIIETGFDPTPYKDFDYNTYATPASDLGPGEERQLVQYDFGAVQSELILFARFSGYMRVYGSSDCTSFVLLIDSSGTGAIYTAIITNSRCVRINAFNPDTANIAPAGGFRIHSFEMYTPRLVQNGGSITLTNKRTLYDGVNQATLATIAPLSAVDTCYLVRWVEV